MRGQIIIAKVTLERAPGLFERTGCLESVQHNSYNCMVKVLACSKKDKRRGVKVHMQCPLKEIRVLWATTRPIQR